MAAYFLTCPPGFAQTTKRELQHLGYANHVVNPSTIGIYDADDSAISRINLGCRTGNILYYAVNTKQECLTFDDLFGQTIGIDRVKYIQPGTPVRVLAKTVNSILTSVPTLQSIAAKAIMTRLTGSRDGVWTPDASVPEIEVMIYLIDNIIYICLNTTGESMHRRGYRTHASQASLKETIAAGLVLQSGWKYHKPLYNPCCGAGTIAIEAALIAKNIAPGLGRSFAFQSRSRYDQSIYTTMCIQALDMQHDKAYTIIASDNDPVMIQYAQINAKNAGVANMITRETKDVCEYEKETIEGTMIVNPPYGLRMMQYDIAGLHRSLLSIFIAHASTLTGGIWTGVLDIDQLDIYKAHPSYRKKTSSRNGAEDVIWVRKV